MGSFLVERGHQPVSIPLIPVKSDSTWMARDRQRDIQSCVHCALLVPCLCGCMHVYNHRRLSKWIAWSPIWALGCWAKMTNKIRGPVNDSPGGGGTQRKTQTMVPIRTMKNNAMHNAMHKYRGRARARGPCAEACPSQSQSYPFNQNLFIIF